MEVLAGRFTQWDMLTDTARPAASLPPDSLAVYDSRDNTLRGKPRPRITFTDIKGRETLCVIFTIHCSCQV